MKTRVSIWARRQRTEPTADGLGRKTVDLPDTMEVIELEIDIEAVAQILGQRAVDSKAGKSLTLGGLIVARHVGHAVAPRKRSGQ